MFAPARMPVAEGKKMENMPKKLPSDPRQSGTKLVEKISAVEGEIVSLLESSDSLIFNKQFLYITCVKKDHTHNSLTL